MRSQVFHHLVNGLQPNLIHPLRRKDQLFSIPVMDYRVLPFELFICQLPADAALPPLRGRFYSVTRTAGEVSVVCEAPPAGALRVEGGWSALEVIGPLDFGLTGILASFAVPLADAGISIFAISTFHTDYLLVKTARLQAGTDALAAAGHRRVI